MNNKPKILFIGTLPPPIHGSAVVCQLIKNCKSISASFNCDWINLSTSRGMDEIGRKKPIKLWRFLFALGRALWLLVTNRYDLCYLAITCHGIGFLKDSPFVLLCKLFRRKIIIHQHNKGMANDVSRWPYRWLLPLCYKNVKVILLSWHLYPDIEKVVPKENVVICPNGIPQVNYVYKSRNNSEPHLLFISNLNESKGILLLLDALRFLTKRGIPFLCDIAGGETNEIDAKRLGKEIEERGLKQFVSYHGSLYGADKEALLAKCDIFTLPTNNDCFPLVLLEAMQYGLPCVTTDEGGIKDIIVDGVNGLICPHQNAEALASKLEYLINSVEIREKMGKAGKERMREFYTEENLEKRLEEILCDSLYL